jgi:hypothetical protein
MTGPSSPSNRPPNSGRDRIAYALAVIVALTWSACVLIVLVTSLPVSEKTASALGVFGGALLGVVAGYLGSRGHRR